MLLAEHVAGFPKDRCDEVRRAIMKRSISGGDAAKSKVDEMRSQFVAGAVANGYKREIAENIYQKVTWFSGYGFNCLSKDAMIFSQTRGYVKIKDVIPGEYVLSPFGFVKVLNQLNMGRKKTYIVRTKQGKTLRCTKDHQFETPDGLKTLDQLMNSSSKICVL